MLLFTSDPNRYLVYPSWAKLKYDWNLLPKIFFDPASVIAHEDKVCFDFDKFDMTPSPMEFIDAPVGGGVIVYRYPNFAITDPLSPQRRWKGDIIFRQEYFERNPLFGAPATTFYSTGVSYLTKRANGLTDNCRNTPRCRQYHIDGSFDHLESVGKQVYFALVSSHKQLAPKFIDSFSYLAGHFGLTLEYIDKIPSSIRSDKSFWFRDKKNIFQWYILATECRFVKRIFSYLLYCGLHIKKQCPAFDCIQLVAQIESQPQGRMQYHQTESEEEAAFQKKRAAIEEMESLLTKMPVRIRNKILRKSK